MPAIIAQLTPSQRQLVIEMFANGYTLRYIRKKLTTILELPSPPSENELMQLVSAYATDIEAARRELDQMTLSSGLASKATRVRRLTELAEEWEDSAKSQTKAAQVYMKAIQQIQGEIEPLGLLLIDPNTDPWGRLLVELRERAAQPITGVLPSPVEDEDTDANL